nr:curved dna-binding protein (42 kda protein) [Colletotrichum truncatum]KAF6785413.1 curved dna-binding protein (42 kda protein) [Colletotrichum truncatum]
MSDDKEIAKPQERLIGLTRLAELEMRTHIDLDHEANHLPDYTLNNPDTLTKYKTAAQISEKVLAAVAELCVPGEKIVTICEKGDKLIEEELAKVYRGKKVNKGFSHPTTVSPASFVTPYTPLTSDEAEANVEIQAGEPIKIQLGAQIDGFGSIVCDTIIAAPKEKAGEEITGRSADLILANYYANELLLRLMLPPGLLASGTDEEKAKAAAAKAPTQAKITSLLEKVVKSFDCNLVESTTSWLFERNEIEGKKKIVLAPSEGSKGDGVPEIGEVWGVEMGVSLGAGKVKTLDQRTTLHRRTLNTYGLKRPTSRKILSEVQKKFGTFPFSLRQLEDERDAKSGVVECVRGNVFRAYEVVGDKDNSPVARYLTTIAITKNGITKLGAPPALDLSKVKSDKKIEDEEILKILEQPLARNTGSKSKNKKKKKKPAKKAAAGEEEESDEE